MESVAYKILKAIRGKREMTLGDIYKMCEKKFKDHRDLYPFVCLITGGYVDSVMTQDGRLIKESQNKELAITLFTATFGKGNFEYMGLSLINGGDGNKQTFFITAKADLYLRELAQRRWDRIFSLGIGIVVGIIVAIFSTYLRSYSGCK